MGYIYLMYNTVTTKIYIGQTTHSIEHRMLGHFSKSEHNKDIMNDIEKYGKESFEIYRLAECNNDRLNELEKYYIKIYDSYNIGYNMTKGGGNTFTLYDEDKVMDLYSNGESINNIQGITGYTWHVVKCIIDKNNTDDIIKTRELNIKNNYKNGKIPIIMLDKGLTQIQAVFESKLDAYNFLCKEQNKNIDKQNFYTRVTIACSTDRICYNHRWRTGNNIDNLLAELNNRKDVIKSRVNKFEIAFDTEDMIKSKIETDSVTEDLVKIDMYQERTSKKPDKKVLQYLISIMSYEEIGRQYDVTGKTVRNWCDSYGLERKTVKKPDKIELKNLLNSYNVKEIAEIFDVADGTVRWWIKDLDIKIERKCKTIICENTGKEFCTYKAAGEYMKTLFPYTMDAKYVGNEIRKSIENNTLLHGIKWSLK